MVCTDRADLIHCADTPSDGHVPVDLTRTGFEELTQPCFGVCRWAQLEAEEKAFTPDEKDYFASAAQFAYESFRDKVRCMAAAWGGVGPARVCSCCHRPLQPLLQRRCSVRVATARRQQDEHRSAGGGTPSWSSPTGKSRS